MRSRSTRSGVAKKPRPIGNKSPWPLSTVTYAASSVEGPVKPVEAIRTPSNRLESGSPKEVSGPRWGAGTPGPAG